MVHLHHNPPWSNGYAARLTSGSSRVRISVDPTKIVSDKGRFYCSETLLGIICVADPNSTDIEQI